MLQWNAEGVFGKKEALRDRLKEHDVDIACIQETHLSEKNRFMVRGYQTLRMDRKEGPKGGVVILVKNGMAALEITTDTGDGAEIDGVRLSCHNR